MTARGNLSALCGALLLAASATALSAGTAQAQSADDLDQLGARVLDNPQDADLNMRYAAAAEAAGKPRLALVAYERILINDPSNVAARHAYERVRRQIEPGYTVTRLDVGARWDSNPLDLNDDIFFFGNLPDAVTYYGQLMVANESEFAGRRWRSIFNLDVEATPEIDNLDYDYLGAQTGPIFYAGPHLAFIPSVGAGAAWLSGEHYFNELYLSGQLEGRAAGNSYWARLRAGYRDYDPDTTDFSPPIDDSGAYVELQAGLTVPAFLLERGTLLVSPFLRWSDISVADDDFASFDHSSPGKFFEYGADVNYNYQLTDHIQTSIGVLLRQRNFSNQDRDDTYISPQAAITLQRLLPCDCDLTLRYRHRDNDSSDFVYDYTANQVSLQLTTRF